MPELNKKVVRWFPGATLAGASLAIPTGSPLLESVIGAYILRLSSSMTVSNHAAAAVAASIEHAGATLAASVANHAPADVVAAIGNHTEAQVAAGLANHPVHAHDLVSIGTGAPPAGGNLGLPAGLNVANDSAAAVLHTMAGHDVGGGNVRNNAAAQAHAAGAAVAHAAGAAVAHAATAVASAHEDAGVAVAHTFVGSDPIVAATATKVDSQHVTLNVPTNIDDMLVLTFFEVGAALKVA